MTAQTMLLAGFGWLMLATGIGAAGILAALPPAAGPVVVLATRPGTATQEA